MPLRLPGMNRFLLAFALIHSSCNGEEHDDHADHADHGEGTASGAECDPSLTYESFGMMFMTSYCTSCHSSTLTGTARNGAPEGEDYDTLDGVLAAAEHIDAHAAAGPDATNEEMPPSGAMPTTAEREMLGAWLACETAP